jgi:hypothetical protein
MLSKLKEIIFGKPPLEINHAFFGKILFMGDDIPKESSYWEAELKVKESKEPITIIINAPKEGPDKRHVSFCKNCLSDLDALFEKCWPIFEPDFQQWTGKTFNGKWHDSFELMSIEIPTEGDANNEWTVGYYVDAASHYFTARFVDGKPKYNEIDG